METNTDETAKKTLRGYRFNINDFTKAQVHKIKMCCLQFTGNGTLKKKLRDVINNQLDEEKRYYKIVAEKRWENSSDRWMVKAIHKLRLPQSWLTKLETRKKEDKPTNETYKSWQPPGSSDDLASQEYPAVEALAALQPDSTSISGWERIKRAVLPKYFVENYSYTEPSHTFNLKCMLNCALGTGSVVGLIMAYAYGRSFLADFDRTNLSNMYESKYDAHRKRHDAFFKGYIRYLYRWGWRISFLVGSLVIVSQSLCIYRLKDSMAHYVAAAAVPFGLYKWTRGPRGMLVMGTIGGLFFGVPIGFIFGTCGCNLRPMMYDSQVLPALKSPYHWYNWSPEQLERSELRTNAILEEIKRPRDKEETEKSQVYKDLLASAEIDNFVKSKSL